MATKQEKTRLMAAVSVAYVIVWAGFFLTHDAGEVSE